MRFNRISIKLGVTIISLLLVVLLPLGFVLNQVVSSFYYSQIEDEINTLSSNYANAITQSGTMKMVQMIETIADFSNVRLVAVDKDGQLIVSSAVPGMDTGMLVSGKQRELLARGEELRGEYVDPSTGSRYLVSAKPFFMGEFFAGGVYVLSSLEDIERSLYQLRQMFILSGAGAFLLALGIILVMSRKLSAPLVQMEKATRKIARGNLETRINMTSGDETGSLAKAINDLAIDLKRYRDTRREFFANISHELRTPITYLEGYANVLKEEFYQTEEEKDQYLTIISNESKRLVRLIEDLFDLSKIEEGKLSLHHESIDLQEIAEDAIQRASLKAKDKGIDLKLVVNNDIELVVGDGLRMQQIFGNLLDNAIRYTDIGSVGIKLESLDTDEVKVTIEDTGKGIPLEELPYIFERFYRVEKSRSREHGGTGLGLSIVKQLTELQEGEIEVYSEVGKGTRFEIKFPKRKNDESESGAE